MLYIVCYDIEASTKAGRRRLSRTAKLLERHGTRVQYSVFEVRMPPDKFRYVRACLLEVLNRDRDSLRIYTIADGDADTEHHGVRAPMEIIGVLFFD